MSLIDISYFVGELNIPNRGNTLVIERINFFIDRYEKEFLYKILGVGCFNDFIAGINASTPETKWTNLKNGCEFINTYNVLDKYYGLVNNVKKSPIAYYVYYHFLRDGYTQTAGIGEVKANAENATVVSPAGKMISAWNEMVDLNRSLLDFLYVNGTDYPKYNLAFVDRDLLSKQNSFNI